MFDDGRDLNIGREYDSGITIYTRKNSWIDPLPLQVLLDLSPRKSKESCNQHDLANSHVLLGGSLEALGWDGTSWSWWDNVVKNQFHYKRWIQDLKMITIPPEVDACTLIEVVSHTLSNIHSQGSINFIKQIHSVPPIKFCV